MRAYFFYDLLTRKPSIGTGIDIGGEPAIDEDDAEYKLGLDKSELASLLDDEDYRAQQAIDKEREKDETAVSIC